MAGPVVSIVEREFIVEAVHRLYFGGRRALLDSKFGRTDPPPAEGSSGVPEAGPLVSEKPPRVARLHRILSGLSRRLRMSDRPYVLVLALAVACYVAYWSYLTLARFYALHADVWDLGASMQSFWSIAHVGYHPTELAFLLGFRGILFVLSPISYGVPPSALPPFLLILQSLLLGTSALPLYAVARHRLRDSRIALGIGLAYLAYFPMAGVNWFDFHFQMLFIPLFVWGYYFFDSDRLGLSLAFFFLSGVTREPYYVFPLLFSLVVLFELAWKRHGGHEIPVRPLRFAVALLALTTLLGVLEIVAVEPTVSLPSDIHATALNFALPHLYGQTWVLIGILGPLLFLPLLSKRWIVFLLPFFALVLVASYPPYQYPWIFQNQYPSGVVPFVWLGFIDGLVVLQRGWNRTRARREVARARPNRDRSPTVAGASAAHRGDVGILSRARRKMVSRPHVVVTAAMIVLVAGTALVFEPYGPLNGISTDNFHAGAATNVNWSRYHLLTEVVSLIPPGAGGLVIQNNLPQALIDHYSTVILTPDLLGSPTPSAIARNTFEANGNASTYAVDYVLGDVSSPMFTARGDSGSETMAILAQTLYASGTYSVEAEAAGLFLLARNYSGPVQLFAPYDQTFSAPELLPRAGTLVGGLIEGTDLLNGSVLSTGPSASVLPGEYEATLSMLTTDTSTNNTLEITVSVGTEGTLRTLASFPVRGTSFFSSDAWVSLVVRFHVPGVFATLEISPQGLDWPGTVELSGIGIVQLDG